MAINFVCVFAWTAKQFERIILAARIADHTRNTELGKKFIAKSMGALTAIQPRPAQMSIIADEKSRNRCTPRLIIGLAALKACESTIAGIAWPPCMAVGFIFVALCYASHVNFLPTFSWSRYVSSGENVYDCSWELK